MAIANSLRALSRESSDISKSDLFSVAPELLLEEEGFNTRGAFCDDYYEQPEIKEGIRVLADAYMRGDYVPPIIVKVRDGQIFVREGHRRRRALLQAISEGAEIRKVQVVEHKGDEAQQTLLIATSNDGLPLKPLERAVVYGRLASWGWSDQEIAKKVGRTPEHVRTSRALLELPLELKQMIQTDQVSATLAAELFREHGEKAIDLLKENQEQEQPKKVTRSQVTKTPTYGKKVIAAMHRGLHSITTKMDSMQLSDDGRTFTLQLTPDEVELLNELKDKLGEFEDPAMASPGNTETNSNQMALDLEHA